MEDQILSHLDNPAQLERLYRADKAAFKRAFNALPPDDLQDRPLTGFWQARLNFSREELSQGSRTDLVFTIIAALLAGLIAKLPAMLHLNEEIFYTRNIGFILFPALSAYFARQHRLPALKIAFIAGATLAGLIFINALPRLERSDTLLLSCIHLPIFLWFVTGFAFTGEAGGDFQKRLGYLRYNGDLIVITTLILIAGAILSGVTIGLFQLIGMNFEQFYFNYIIVFGLAAAPILGTYLIRTNPQLVGKVSPVIARIFSPLVLAMLLVYLVAILYSGKDPYNDRQFLLIFNVLLLGVMAIIFFSIAETSVASQSRPETGILLLLSVVTIVVNGIALSAILFRISAWGLTPNRAAVLGGNVLILIHLFLVTYQLFRVLTGKADLNRVGKAITAYLPVYWYWVILVTFLFPFLFGFR